MTPLERTRFSSLCALMFAVTATLGAQSAPAIAHSSALAGKVEVHTVFDSTYRRPRQIWVYTAPGYDAKATTAYPLIIAFDGDEYRDTMPLPMVLDTLVAAGKAPAFVAVLIDNGEGAVRIADLGNAHRMADFLAKQLVPWVPRKPVRFVLDVGALEDHATLGGAGPNFRDASRRFRDALVAKGYDVTYTEVPGANHAPQWWKTRLADGIVQLSADWPGC
jgi:enterochelin esterase-like enzyme